MGYISRDKIFSRVKIMPDIKKSRQLGGLLIFSLFFSNIFLLPAQSADSTDSTKTETASDSNSASKENPVNFSENSKDRNSASKTQPSLKENPDILKGESKEGQDTNPNTTDPSKTGTEPGKETGLEELKEIKNPTIKDVQSYYNAGNYRAVLTAVQKMKPSCLTHYYTGLAYQHTNRHYNAAIEYNYVKNNAKDPTLRANAAQALNSLYRQKSQIKKNRREKRDVANEFKRYSEDGYTGNGEANLKALEQTQRLEREKRLRPRSPNQDRYYRSYKVPEGLNKTPAYRGNVVPYNQ